MKRLTSIVLIAAICVTASLAQSEINTDPDAAKFVTTDIELFWKAYDKATPENDLIVFRDEYLKIGSEGLKEFSRLRIGNSCNLVGTISQAKAYYDALREPSMRVADFEPQVRKSFHRLKELYPDSVFPDVYFLIGRMSSAGTLSPQGLYIGVDMFGANTPGITDGLSDWHRAVLGATDRIPFVVVHEAIHYQQKYPPNAVSTLLARSLKEGVADFVAELASGDNINPHLHKYGNPIERELWLEFEKEMLGQDVSNWLYQGEEAKTRPADLGYYMGYKIAQSYHKNAADKKIAVKEMLEIKDFEAFLAASKYQAKFK
ncbi:MAG TPA: DUF2268 domain-containing putative Zn-dependent protease [Pyrinomonadaceae bacterium]|nr:DUF2268 domain-containing putative Zn-dependent protease [Pyrinomonadaceae bacterium]